MLAKCVKLWYAWGVGFLCNPNLLKSFTIARIFMAEVALRGQICRVT
jgi:hypothetical protein